MGGEGPALAWRADRLGVAQAWQSGSRKSTRPTRPAAPRRTRPSSASLRRGRPARLNPGGPTDSAVHGRGNRVGVALRAERQPHRRGPDRLSSPTAGQTGTPQPGGSDHLGRSWPGDRLGVGPAGQSSSRTSTRPTGRAARGRRTGAAMQRRTGAARRRRRRPGASTRRVGPVQPCVHSLTPAGRPSQLRHLTASTWQVGPSAGRRLGLPGGGGPVVVGGTDPTLLSWIVRRIRPAPVDLDRHSPALARWRSPSVPGGARATHRAAALSPGPCSSTRCTGPPPQQAAAGKRGRHSLSPTPRVP